MVELDLVASARVERLPGGLVPAARRLRDGRPDTGFSPDTTIKVYAIDIDTPELNLTREIALPNRFDLHALGGKVQVAWTGEREVVALGGGVARAGSSSGPLPVDSTGPTDRGDIKNT